jgi:uncharacterized membrane protein
MKKYILPLLSTILVFSVAFTSCKKEEVDNTAPVISSVSEPLDNDTLFTGNELHVEATITDDVELSQLKIDIHSADGHSHGKIAAGALWEKIVIMNLSGTSQTIHEHIEIPADIAAGAYHVIFTAVDKSGNSSEILERDIIIRNSSDLIAPVITVSAPAAGSSITAGNDLLITGEVVDNLALRTLEIKVYRGTTLVSDNDIDLAAATYTINQTINTIGWTPGAYTIELVAYDDVLNIADLDIEITVN